LRRFRSTRPQLRRPLLPTKNQQPATVPAPSRRSPCRALVLARLCRAPPPMDAAVVPRAAPARRSEATQTLPHRRKAGPPRLFPRRRPSRSQKSSLPKNLRPRPHRRWRSRRPVVVDRRWRSRRPVVVVGRRGGIVGGSRPVIGTVLTAAHFLGGAVAVNTMPGSNTAGGGNITAGGSNITAGVSTIDCPLRGSKPSPLGRSSFFQKL